MTVHGTSSSSRLIRLWAESGRLAERAPQRADRSAIGHFLPFPVNTEICRNLPFRLYSMTRSARNKTDCGIGARVPRRSAIAARV
jgi:hypothetical protein